MSRPIEARTARAVKTLVEQMSEMQKAIAVLEKKVNALARMVKEIKSGRSH